MRKRKNKEMQLGEREDFSNLCGIAKVEHEGEEIFVAFADYFDFSGEYGTIVGKGKSENDALKMALVKMCENLEKLSNEIEQFRDMIDKLKITSDPLNFDENPIIAIESDDIKYFTETNEYEIKPSGKFVNADLFMVEGKACLGIH